MPSFPSGFWSGELSCDFDNNWGAQVHVASIHLRLSFPQPRLTIVKIDAISPSDTHMLETQTVH